MKAVIIEDELNVREGFRKLIQAFCPTVSVVGTAVDVETGLELISKVDFDVLFLDINLPDGSGFDLLHRKPDKHFHTIFVTAYDQYAIDAFKISATDYLLKPVSPDLLKKAVAKVEKKNADFTDNEESISIAKDHLKRNFQQSERIILRGAESMQIVQIKEIVYCAAQGSYTSFFLLDQREIMVSINLKEYEGLLEPYGFVRCHHSYLINLYHVTSLQKADGGTVILSNEISIPLSTRKRAHVVEALKERFVG